MPREADPAQRTTGAHRSRGALVLGAVGIVFGDIGTSPLYTFQQCIGGEHGVGTSPASVLGVLSLILWALVLVVTVKYMAFLMRADNHGEGGILALLALLPERARARAGAAIDPIAVLVVAGAALLFGDGIITPAISVLSAVEGIEVATTRFAPFVVPATCVILAALFAIQSRGTGGIGTLFGPVMVVWFATIGALGAWHVAHAPEVLAALSPVYGVRFFATHGFRGFAMLGSVVLAVTGGEALYADMGHFGKGPIRTGWLGLVLPSLALCYLGQGALVLRHPASAAAPFFGMVPIGFATYALVALATPATVIASQALISGVFSLTHQAVQLGYFPRVEVRHTSGESEGQIYVPALNRMLAVACIALVLGFQHSSRLAGAYGVAVSGTMAITSIVAFVVTREAWHWSLGRALALLVFFLSFDVPFVLANLLKFLDGGYVPLAAGVLVFVVMIDWHLGRSALRAYFDERAVTTEDFLASLPGRGTVRTPGVAVVLTPVAHSVPPVLERLVVRLGVLPEVVVLLTVTPAHEPVVAPGGRLQVDTIGPGFYRVVARSGFRESPDVPALLAQAIEAQGLPLDLATVTYVVGHETFVAGSGGRMGRVTETLFAFLARNAHSMPRYFNVPRDQLIELGSQIDL